MASRKQRDFDDTSFGLCGLTTRLSYQCRFLPVCFIAGTSHHLDEREKDGRGFLCSSFKSLLYSRSLLRDDRLLSGAKHCVWHDNIFWYRVGGGSRPFFPKNKKVAEATHTMLSKGVMT
jgi:hypothetical protein